MRIVSLIASATEIVHGLGLTPYQVGRSHECDYPESILDVPVCTRPAFATGGSSAEIDAQVKSKLSGALSIYEVFEDVLERLQPTHIITQTQCKVCAVSLEDVERALARSVSSRPKVVPLQPNDLAGIWSGIAQVADSCGAQTKLGSFLQDLQGRMAAISERAFADPIRPRVACIEWHEPLMAGGNWIPELIEQANAVNLFGEAGRHSPRMTWSDLQAADPDVIVTSPCGFDLQRTESEMYWLTQNPSWAGLRAVRNGQVYLVDGNRFMSRPGPRVVESLEILAEILHPNVFQPAFEHHAWRRHEPVPVS